MARMGGDDDDVVRRVGGWGGVVGKSTGSSRVCTISYAWFGVHLNSGCDGSKHRLHACMMGGFGSDIPGQRQGN